LFAALRDDLQGAIVLAANGAAFAAWIAQDHAAEIVEGLEARDVRVRENEIGDCARLRQRKRELVRSALDVGGLPIKRPIAIHVVATHGVFVDAAVAIVVYPFRTEQSVFAGFV